MHNGAFRVCVLARSHVVDHRTRTCIGKHVVNVGVHSCLRIIFPWLFLSLFSFSRFFCPFPLFLSRSLFPSLSLSRPRRRPTTYDEESSHLFYSLSRPVIVDTTDRNDCFTPPLARELGNKLAAGLISLSRSMTAPPRLRRQGLMFERGFRDLMPEFEDTIKIVYPGASQDQWLCSLARAKCDFVKNRSIPRLKSDGEVLVYLPVFEKSR